MKKAIVFFAVLSMPLLILAQVPSSFKYQAVVRDAEGFVIAEEIIGVKISILQGSILGESVCTEEFSPESNEFGLINLEIGSVNPTDFAAINWTNGPYFLKIELDIEGTSSYIEFGTSQLLSVPYALHANTADNITGDIEETDPVFTSWDKDYNDLTNTPVIPTIPEDVSEFNNDAGYLTSFTETDPLFTAWDKDYNDLTNTPIIPTIPEDVSEFNNDAGYLTSFTETDPLFNSWDKDYNDLINTPLIPTIPENISEFTNDAGYLTSFSETDSIWVASPSHGITNTNITNWNSAYGWGNHSGLYRPIAWVPAWTDVTGKPTFATVATSGSFSDLTGKPTTIAGYGITDVYNKTNMQTSGQAQLHFNNLTSKPTTIAGYGITNAMTTSHAANAITSTNITNWNSAYGWGNHAGLYRPISWVPAWTDITGKPTTIAGFGITDVYTKTNMQTNGQSQLHFNNLTNKPTTIAGYGITDAMSTSHAANGITSTNITNWNSAYGWGNHSGLYRPISWVPAWTDITGKPTTIAGYGITNAMSTSHPANVITATNISNWNSAYGWGNHSGLYRPIAWVPAWTDITGKPTFATVATSGNFSDLSGKPTTIAGYGISDAMSTSHAANSITGTNITNWNTAYGWGNHASANYLPQSGGTMTGALSGSGSSTTLSGFNASFSTVTATTYTLAATDNGKVITLNNASAITLTVPAGLPTGFNCLIVQTGAGKITLTASGTTIQNRQSFTKTAGQYAITTLVHIGSNVFISSGDME